MIQKLADYNFEQLDIRRIIKNSISLQDFLRSSLTHQQKVLMAHQWTRVATLDHCSSESVNAIDATNGKIDALTFHQEIAGFKPKSRLDRQLIQGLLYRNGIKHSKQRHRHIEDAAPPISFESGIIADRSRITPNDISLRTIESRDYHPRKRKVKIGFK